ncbi:MAG: PDZ domain-containing protein [Oscillospiraceae bacterium]|nr:PDZ domain-containing protein [Oscillospiraceae bacterium]
MKKVQKILSYVLVAILSSVVTLTLFGGTQTQTNSKLDDITQIIETYFIGDVDRAAMEDAAATAMIGSLGDKWSYYMSAPQYALYLEQMHNAYVGIGITITPAEDGSGLLVTQVNQGGSAEEVGMKPGDVIVEIEGHSAAGMTTTQARDLVRGEEGTQVKLAVRRDGERIDLTITRKTVETPVAEAQLLKSGVGLITIYNFDDRCADETIAAIENLVEQGAHALVFDVRGNPGGYKHELVKLLDYLLPEGVLFRSEDYTGKVTVDESDANFLDMPMAVLVDANSFSAAEFFAAAMAEYDAAVVVGQPTTGKGYFQTTFVLSDGSAIGLSVGKYTTPNGVSLANVGIKPEIPVEVDEDTEFAIYAGIMDPEEDPQIQAAVKALENE